MKLSLSVLSDINIPQIRTLLFIKYNLKISGDGLSSCNFTEIADYLGLKTCTVRGHIKTLLSRGYLKIGGSREGVRCVGWKKIGTRLGENSSKFIHITNDQLKDKDLFKQTIYLGAIEFERRFLSWKRPKNLKRDEITKVPFKLSAVRLGALFGKSKTWGSRTRKWLVERNALCMKRCRYPLPPNCGLADAAESLGIHVHWDEAQKCFIQEDIADCILVCCPFVRVR